MSGSEAASELGRNVLVIGAYGLIGSGVARRLVADGHRVTGLGRDIGTARRVLPDVSWIVRDMSALRHADDWAPILAGQAVVVNCSGALQDGPSDDLEAIHNHSVAALAAACAASDVRLVQISAVGAGLDAPTPFLASKARGDAAIRASGARYQIFRPGLVIAPHAYGGSAMLRMLAAVPLVQPIAMPQALIQTVSLADLAHVVSAAVEGRCPDGFEADLVEAEPHPLQEVVAAMRHWLGFGPARWHIVVPAIGAAAVCRIADAISLLGWRSPLRTTAFRVLTDGVRGRPADLSPFGLPPMTALAQTLANMPARVEDRLFARMTLLMPLMVVTLIGFWLASGVIGLARVGQAAGTLEGVGWPHALAVASVIFWALVDIGIAGALAFRRYAPLACWAAIAVSALYLAASTLLVPQLWLDPLGPLTKIFPAMVLALATRAALETR